MTIFIPKLLLLLGVFLNAIAVGVCMPLSLSLPTTQRSQRTGKQKAKTNQSDVEALVAAAARGDTARIAQLIKNGVDINGKASRNAPDSAGRTALMAAAAYGRTEAVNLLL